MESHDRPARRDHPIIDDSWVHKFSPDWCFGLLKKKCRRTKVGGLTDLVSVVNESSVVNIAQLMSTKDGKVLVTTYNWQSFFAEHCTKITVLRSFITCVSTLLHQAVSLSRRGHVHTHKGWRQCMQARTYMRLWWTCTQDRDFVVNVRRHKGYCSCTQKMLGLGSPQEERNFLKKGNWRCTCSLHLQVSYSYLAQL